jgi:redox-sensitive bicupin YhaK (pirin superfamily)
MGNSAVMKAGDVQRISAGTGILHSEHNWSPVEPVHLLQIWLLPDSPGGEPGYEQKAFPPALRRGRLALVASPDGADGSVTVRADARIHAGLFDGGESQRVVLEPSRPHYLFLARGVLGVNGQRLSAGDALTVTGERELALAQGQDAEVLLFTLSA